jgi:hypothetical protein
MEVLKVRIQDRIALQKGKVFTKLFPDPTRPRQWSDWLPLEDQDPSIRTVFPVGAPVTALSTGPGRNQPLYCGCRRSGQEQFLRSERLSHQRAIGEPAGLCYVELMISLA